MDAKAAVYPGSAPAIKAALSLAMTTATVGGMKIALKYGAFMALTSAAFTLVMYFAGFHESMEKMQSAQMIGFLGAFAIGITFLALAMKEARAKAPIENTWGYGGAFGTGVLTALFAALFGAIFGYCYFAFINPGFSEAVLQGQMAAMEAKGMSSAQLERAEPMMRKWMSPPVMTVMQGISGFIMSTILAAIVAIFFRKRDELAGSAVPPVVG
jgi:energy-converting hydrogenase Eha subunit A